MTEENKEVTNDELAIMIGKGFKGVDEKFVKIEDDIIGIKTDVSELRNDVSELKINLQNVRSEIATKDFVTKKIADLKGDLILPLKKENEKLDLAVDKLGDKKVFDSSDIEEVKKVEVFLKVA
uniref:Uncharacterized protein n=1 Tax=candidate division CPR3 bacterium TaxID=2268181 RepID=A0A7C4M028_UNCC3